MSPVFFLRLKIGLLQLNPTIGAFAANREKLVAAYARAVDWVRSNPAESRTHLDGFTAIEEALVKEVPLSGFTLYNEFKPADIEHFQKFFDVFTDRKIFSKRVDVKSLLYTA